jgi:hypothetical protein
MPAPRLVLLQRCLLGSASLIALSGLAIPSLSPRKYVGGALLLLGLVVFALLVNLSPQVTAYRRLQRAALARRLTAHRERARQARQLQEQRRQETLRRLAEDRQRRADQEAEAAARRQAAYERRMAVRPPPRLIRTPREAELVAAEWMRYLGFHDARVTGPGADGGIDVTSAIGFAQVKMEGKPTGRPALQRLHGAAQPKGRCALFFSLRGYTSQAAEYAGQVRMALFVFNWQGEPTPRNDTARQLMEAADRRAEALEGSAAPL